MSDPHPNHTFAATLVDQLVACGVRAACVSPGSRSAPLALALARHPEMTLYMHVDERSGSFFALGLAKASGRPVALLCTSGTAAAEFHPAVVEAHQSQTPLIVLTADRPPELRDVGANQAIDQHGIYGSAVRWAHDPGPPEPGPGAARAWRRLALRAVAEATGPPAGPVHLNLPFREPLVPEPGIPGRPLGETVAGRRGSRYFDMAPEQEVLRALEGARRPVVVAGEMRDGGRLAAFVANLVEAGIPVLAEPTSQLRLAGTVATYDALLRSGPWADAHRPDVVVRLGAALTSRALNAWLAASGARIVLSDPDGLWRDPDGSATDVVRQEPFLLLAHIAQEASPETGWTEAWGRADAAARAALDSVMSRVPLFEGHAVRALCGSVPASAWLFAGSSMPVRAVDTFWTPGPDIGPGSGRRGRLIANRGASGIDGLVSTGLGMAVAAAPEPAVVMLGDLSLYHDMNGLWAVGRHHVPATLLVLDNGGGGIFDFLPPARHGDVFEEVFTTPLNLDLERVAALYSIRSEVVNDPAGIAPALDGAVRSGEARMVIVRFARGDSVTGHRACWEAVAAAI